MDNNLNGKTVVLVGGTRGMGRRAAVEMAAMGAHLVLIGHDQARGASAAAECTAAGAASARFFRADLTQRSEVERVAAQVLAAYPRVHVLVNNAAAFRPTGARTPEGVDEGFAINFLAAYALTRRLEPALVAAKGARVINVTSMGHRMVKKVDLDLLLRPGKHLSVMDSYGVAKLAMVTFSYGLAKRLQSKGVTVNVLDPHMVETEIGAQFDGNAFQRWVMFTVLPALFGTTQDKAAQYYLHLAAASELEGVTGGYFVKTARKDSSPLSHDEVLARRIDEAAEAWAFGPSTAAAVAG
jgi:NAD(P)-dependent dehydrogenase (short-subunit alcohol dehydrogenase family)